MEELTAPYRTNDLDALQSLAEQRRALEQELRELNIRLSTLLEGKTLEAWFEDRTQVKQQLQELLAEFPQWQRADPDADALKRQAETLEREFVEQVESAEQEWQDFQEAFRQAQQTLIGHQQHIRTIEERLTEVRSQLQALRQDGLSDEERRQQLRRVAMQADALRGQLADIQQQLQQFGTDPRPTVAALEQQIGKLADERQSRKQQVDQLYGALEALAPEAPYTALTALEEEIEQLGRRIERERLRAEAFRLLHQTVSQVREETLSSLTGPIEKEAVATLQRIAGSKFQRVTFNESLVPDGIVPQVDNRAIGLDQISGGEQEQLYFAVRMALAHVAFPNERHLVVLDDVFTYTDAVRLARIQTILDEAADRFQVVLLTCHPERYFALKDVKSFDLEKLAATG
ncbi:MAG: hypothetical protein KatS3mg110_1392 [Pirellulaceae bacterium]|nr:MAG: hypothetical protein KatS3mg110_1392 [Pirellulaceae bacterium]